MGQEKELRILLADNDEVSRKETAGLLTAIGNGRWNIVETVNMEQTDDHASREDGTHFDFYIISDFRGPGKELVRILNNCRLLAVLYTASAPIVQAAIEEEIPVIAKGERTGRLEKWVLERLK